MPRQRRHARPDPGPGAWPVWTSIRCGPSIRPRRCPTDLARSRDWLARPEHHLIGWHDPDYPALLRRIASPPLALFVAGDPALLWHPGVAVVGSRMPTAGGRDHAHDFAHALAASGLVGDQRAGGRCRCRRACRRAGGRRPDRSPCSAPVPTCPTRAAMPPCMPRSAHAARSSANIRPARRRGANISPAATASSPASRWRRW